MRCGGNGGFRILLGRRITLSSTSRAGRCPIMYLGLDHDLVWLDRNTKMVFQERHYLEHRDRIKDSSRHQWRSVS